MNILIVDTNSHMAQIIHRAVLKLPFVGKVSKAVNNSDAFDLCRTGHFDCYIIEEYLAKNESGLELVKRIKEVQERAMILLITGYPEKSLIARAYKAGIDDFVRKDTLRVELSHRVSRLYQLRLSNIQPCHTISFFDLSYYPNSHTFGFRRNTLKLSKGQKELLVIFIMSPGILLRREELRARLWRDDYSDTFAKNRNLPERIYELKKRLPSQVAQCIESVRGEGYIFRANSSAYPKN